MYIDQLVLQYHGLKLTLSLSFQISAYQRRISKITTFRKTFSYHKIGRASCRERV